MARNRRTRDTTDISTPRVSFASPSVAPGIYPISILSDIEDNRTWDPEYNNRPVRTLSGNQQLNRNLKDTRAQDQMRGLRKFPGGTKAYIGYQAPDNITHCVRKETRKQVLHALNKTGAGKSKRRAKWNSRSRQRCK